MYLIFELEDRVLEVGSNDRSDVTLHINLVHLMSRNAQESHSLVAHPDVLGGEVEGGGGGGGVRRRKCAQYSERRNRREGRE